VVHARELSPGATFAGHVIRGIAGRGGMGIVYRATDVQLKRDVALKVITPHLSQDDEFRHRFRREFRAAASIQHPNVIPIHHAGEEGGQLYVTMRYVEGTDLARLLATEGRLEPRQAASIIGQVADALDAAHRAGIVHRDVKPANVLIEVDDDGMHAVLTDFGLMKDLASTSQITQAGALIGTFDYAAPEQLKEGPVDARTDVYALGAVLYQTLTGKVPFPRETAAATMLAQLESPPPSLLAVLPDASELLGEVVRRAMAKDPDARFPSAGDLGRAAQAAVNDRQSEGGERSVATGAASPEAPPTLQPVPLPPALSVETGHGPFAGRAELLRALDGRYSAAEGGRRQFALLVGEPGIGKTRLATELARRAHRRGATVLYGRSDPESLVPYQPFITALAHYATHRERLRLPPELALELSELARFVPALRPHVPEHKVSLAEEPEARRYRLFEGVTRLLALAARERPLVLILDDLHWADASTSLLLGHLLSDAAPIRLLVIGTARAAEKPRADELVEVVSRMRRQPSFERIELEGLTAEEARTLVGRDATSQFVRRLTEETEGNPFFIEETLRSLPELDERALSRIKVPDGVKELISRRLQQLSETANRVLSVAAVIGRQFDLALLEQLLDDDPDAILTVLEEAAEGGLVREVAEQLDRFAFAHALVRETLYESQSTSRRVRLHRRIGERLEASGEANPAELAYHFFEGRAPQAAGYALAAAEQAQAALAYEQAVEHYRRALTDDALDVALALGGAELRAGDPAARGTFARAARLARERGDRDALAQAALGFAGRHAEVGVIDDEGIALLEEALAAHAGDSVTAVELRTRLVECLHFTRMEERIEALSAEALAMANRLDDPRAQLSALKARHAALLHVDHTDERLRLGEELLELAGRIGERELEALGHHWRVYDLLEAADVEGAKRAHKRLALLAAELRQPLYNHFAVGWEVVWAQMAGRVGDAERLAREAYELGLRAQSRDADTIYAAQVLVLRRREDALAEYVSTIERYVSENPSLIAWRAILPMAHLLSGNAEQGVAQFRELARDEFDAVPRDMFWFTAIALLGETCALIGDREQAGVLYRLLEPHSERLVQITQAANLGSTHRFLALLAAAQGDFARAEAHFEAALERNTAAGLRPVVALMRREYAEMLIARGDPVRAQELLRQTLREAEASGMSQLISRVRMRLDELDPRPTTRLEPA
jgi:tetratricopeptide (TPR) repeat protein